MSAIAMLGILVWVALMAVFCALACTLGALWERSRWLVLVRHAAQLRGAAGMNRLIDDSTLVVMHGWRGVPRRPDHAPGREPEPGEYRS